jgi:hypothetical protein
LRIILILDLGKVALRWDFQKIFPSILYADGAGIKLQLLQFTCPNHRSLLIHGQGENEMNKKCNFCGASDYEERRTEYLYSYKGNYLAFL